MGDWEPILAVGLVFVGMVALVVANALTIRPHKDALPAVLVPILDEVVEEDEGGGPRAKFAHAGRETFGRVIIEAGGRIVHRKIHEVELV